MEKLFGLNARITKIIIVASLFMIVSMLYKIIFYNEGKPHFQVISQNGDYYLTTEIIENDGCIIFNDEYNTKTIVCGSYSIKKL